MSISPVDLAVLSLRETDYDRNLRYQRNWRYYKNCQYETRQEGMYASMRSIFNQVTKVVDVDTRFLMGEQLGVQAAPGAAEALAAIWADSDLQQEKYLLGRYGACCGDAFLKVVDNRPWELNPEPDSQVPVLLNVLPPDAVAPRYNPHDRKQMLACKIEYVHGTQVYKEVITPQEILIYDEQDPDQVTARFPNRAGFIPVVHIKHLDVGAEFGLCSFHNLLPTIDALNEVASFMVQIIKLYADPVIVGRGMDRGQLKKQTVAADGKPMATVWWVPQADGSFEMLEWRGNIPEVLAFVDRMEGAIQRYTPELALTLVNEHPTLSGYAISLQLVELVQKIKELRGNYFAGMERANRMALRMLELQGRGDFPDKSNRIAAEPILPVEEREMLRAAGNQGNNGG